MDCVMAEPFTILVLDRTDLWIFTNIVNHMPIVDGSVEILKLS